MSSSTKERILSSAEALMRTRSFHSLGLAEILESAQVPKGSFYHYFESKEQFGVEMIRRYVQQNAAAMRQFFENSTVPALQRFQDYWAYQIGLFTQGACRQCCLVVKLGLEVATFSETMRQAMSDGMTQFRKLDQELILTGQADGSIRRELVPDLASALVQDYWQGAMQRMLVERSVESLRVAARFLSGYLTTVSG